MYLFKASGASYKRVLTRKLHAFPAQPPAWKDELVLLSKNREDCDLLEKQVQAVAKICDIRNTTPAELERLFPGMEAGRRWRCVIELYWVSGLKSPFNLSSVKGLNSDRYNTVQGFAKLEDEDALATLRHLMKTNPDVVLDLVNNAKRPANDENVEFDDC